ncbi:MAG: ribosomal RNA small subunit methyltransferase A [Chlamydiae bacterium GWC2_50_10]|nr:MAG: ribosomal RNA small subunit methyltransferase A [Chlamydiae bacterium GWA2_50_15]OGN54254.1 MAG: ribosomal RNA small subunit methyltransferase A [Chlamydiae bacterium GWC2_50_10]OGN58776.1 MAG: ribosomal RNA small subunit methyltransferase A [Chlamydiae bacterium RIFCSPHIGHO2_02_FULL_49_29]OGN63242.1 MAG: ribosomal RNA small subunit methyltransferase A [Chlamydiae bacterium RIFCSPHIGHO2_12_FULL_49_32]OGN68384.1 MAG: ribosomal RNA small subunit methyltransferase A [Chlamydiae bacterium R
MFRPRELHSHLLNLGAFPKKRLSQNFLIDGNILQKIVHTAKIEKGDCILEIGPGPGALTEALLKRGARVLAVEKDPLFVPSLQNRFPQACIMQGDFLKLSFSDLFQEKTSPWKVVANLPYHLTTPILVRLLSLFPEVDTLTLMVQKEVGERLVAAPKTKAYSRLTLFTHFYSEPKFCFSVSPGSFYPKPSVSSCVMHLTLKSPPKVSSEKGLFEMIGKAFQQRRKMLRTSLKTLFSTVRVERALHALCLPETARPEELSLREFIALFEDIRH